MYDLLLKNGVIVTAQGTSLGDLAVSGDKIVRIAPEIDEVAGATIDVERKYLLPGLIDPNTHFALSQESPAAADGFGIGSLAALYGGVTTVLDEPGPSLEKRDMENQVQELRLQAQRACYVDFGFHGLLGSRSPARQGELGALPGLGVTSLAPGEDMSSQELPDLFALAGPAGLLAMVSAADHQTGETLRRLYHERGLDSPYYRALAYPTGVEAQWVAQVLAAAALAGDMPVYLRRLSCREALDVVREARSRGQSRIYVETCPQYLLLDSLAYFRDDLGGQCLTVPPLRTAADCEALWEGLAGGAIQTVGSDHRGYTLAQKNGPDQAACPLGMPGVEQRLDLLHHYGVNGNRMSISRLVAVTATNPALLFGLYPRKGVLMEGADADIVIYDPDRVHTLSLPQCHGGGDYTPYEGRQVKGGVDSVVLRGELALDRGHMFSEAPRGRFLYRDQGFLDLAQLR